MADPGYHLEDTVSVIVTISNPNSTVRKAVSWEIKLNPGLQKAHRIYLTTARVNCALVSPHSTQKWPALLAEWWTVAHIKSYKNDLTVKIGYLYTHGSIAQSTLELLWGKKNFDGMWVVGTRAWPFRLCLLGTPATRVGAISGVRNFRVYWRRRTRGLHEHTVGFCYITKWTFYVVLLVRITFFLDLKVTVHEMC